jgi:hypothetical protein
MIGTIGGFSRLYPRIVVRVGWKGDAESSFVDSLPPVASSGILSGQLIIKQLVSGVWSYAQATPTLLAAGNITAFAQFDATDPAVLASNLLPGLLCTGKFEIETAFYDAGSYTPGTLLTASATAGNVAARTSGQTQIGIVGSGYDGVGTVALTGTYPNLEYNSETDGSGTSWNGSVLVVQTAYQPVIS